MALKRLHPSKKRRAAGRGRRPKHDRERTTLTETRRILESLPPHLQPDPNDTPEQEREKALASLVLLRREVRVDLIRKYVFVEKFASCGDPAEAARWAGVSWAEAYEWVRDAQSETPYDPDFAKLFESAQGMAEANVESEIKRRGLDGYEEPVIHSGSLVWQAFEKGTGVPLPTVMRRDGAVVVTSQEGLVLDAGEYDIRPLTIKKFSDRLLLARAGALMPKRYARGGGEDDREKTPEEKEREQRSANVADLIRGAIKRRKLLPHIEGETILDKVESDV